MKVYLLLYNLASCTGWAYLLQFVIRGLIESWPAAILWETAGTSLMVIQLFAVLEIFHSLFGLVRSPVLTTVMQVGSRLLVLLLFSYLCPASTSHWTFYFMLGSWSLVEVPRYLFYAINLYMKKPPAILFWLRYNMFAILYPTGIFGEIGQLWYSLSCWKGSSLLLWYFTHFLISLYVPLGPKMYNHMIIQRKRASKKRNEGDQPPKIEEGIVFPKDSKGNRSTTEAGKAVWAAAVRGIGGDLSDKILSERKWRFEYPKYIVSSVSLAAESNENCLRIAQQGIHHVYQSFEFVHNGKTYSLPDAMQKIVGTYETEYVHGSDKTKSKFGVPYKGWILAGDDLIKQLDIWTAYGSIEPDTRNTIVDVIDHEEWHVLSDHYFVLLGASSAMGPIEVLLGLGANIIAVDIDDPKIWKKLIELARRSRGTLTFPLKHRLTSVADEELFASAGCNLLTETPQILHWLTGLFPGKELSVGCYTYLDGAAHVNISIACDLIMSGLMNARKGVYLAFLASPSDVFLVPPGAVAAQERNYVQAPWWQKLICFMSGTKWLARNTGPDITCRDSELLESMHVRSGISIRQGPNYALAKRIQHWRAIIARDCGTIVSANVAPSTATLSVVHNPLFAAAYGGMHLFKPYEVFSSDTSQYVMASLLIHDVCSENSPVAPAVIFNNPLELFSHNSCHGGVWRCAYSLDSIGEISAIAYFMNKVGSVGIFISIVFGSIIGGFVALDLPAPHQLW